MPSNWTIFKALCRVIGGRDRTALKTCLDARQMPQMIAMAASQDVLPALAVRCYEQPEYVNGITAREQQHLRDALRENTRRNMQIVVQSVKLIQTLNSTGITPVLLKGTAQLLTTNRDKPGFRKQADIDLIVPTQSLIAAGDALQAAGYDFYQINQVFADSPKLAGDTKAALATNTTHHHLPALVKRHEVAIVELHRHFLPKRFQHKNPLTPLFASASKHEIQGNSFWVPAIEHQIIHMVLGKFVHDGYLARRQLPLREAADYLDLLDSAQGVFNRNMVIAQCGESFGIFSQLVGELMGGEVSYPTASGPSIKHRMRMMKIRYNSPPLATLLDGYARAEHLAYSLLHNPLKLNAYLRR